MIPSRHSASGTTIFTVMSALAQQYSAINLSQGFPDFPIDERLGALVYEAMRIGFNQYAPMAGLPALRQAISDDFTKRYGLTPDQDHEITITPGATYAIYTAFATILQPGDEVIVLEPAYDSYIPNIEMCGARAVPVRLSAPTFAPDWEAIRAAVSPRTKAIIINTPHNPTGAVWTKSDWDELARTVDGTDMYILSDEVYEQLIYDGATHYTVMQHEALRDRSFALYSFGKVFHNTGWKIGYCIAPPPLTAAFRRIHQFQHGIAAYLGMTDREPVAGLLERKRDYFLELMADTPFTIHRPAGGSYFQLASFEGISDMGDKAFAEWLTTAHGVATIPVSAFYSDGHDNRLLRFCFAKQEETLSKAADRLRML
jgi:methionine aminotransferase